MNTSLLFKVGEVVHKALVGSAVVLDYKNYLTQQEGLTSEEADAQIGSEDVSFWFYEQYIWPEVERDGKLLTKPVPKKYKKFLDFYRDYTSSGPCQDTDMVNFIWNDGFHSQPLKKETSLPPNIEIQDVRVDKEPNLARQYLVRAVPTCILLEDEVEVKRHTGMMSPTALQNFVGSDPAAES